MITLNSGDNSAIYLSSDDEGSDYYSVVPLSSTESLALLS
jgi:hypothetical protein